MCAGVPAALCGRGDGGAGGRTDRVSAPQGAGSFCCCSWAHTPGLAWSSPLSGPHENHLPGAPSQHLTALVESHQELMLAACQPGLCLFLAREEVQGCLLCYAQSTCQRDHRESGSLCHVRAAARPALSCSEGASRRQLVATVGPRSGSDGLCAPNGSERHSGADVLPCTRTDPLPGVRECLQGPACEPPSLWFSTLLHNRVQLESVEMTSLLLGTF